MLCVERFVFFTPFTPDGRAHGQLNQQFKRKTILTVEHHFPYLKSRIRVQSRQTIVMGPIEVCIKIAERYARNYNIKAKKTPENKLQDTIS